MKRGGYIKRRTPIKKRRSKPRRPPGYDDPAYLAAVRKLPCCGPKQALVFEGCIGAWKFWPCDGGTSQAHHAGHKKGTGLKPPDNTAIPLCRAHHTGKHGWHNSNGFAKGWSHEQRRTWNAAKIAETQAKLASLPRTLGEECPF